MERFAFIIHPLDVSDFYRKFPWIRILPNTWLESTLRHLPAFKVSEITGIKSLTGREAQGYFVACPITSRLMQKLPTDYVLNKISESAQLAEGLGAGIVGLGAFTAVVGDAGITVAKKVNIAVTTGNSYTVATALQGIKKAAELLEVDLSSANLAILGANGSIGKACARILAKEVKELTLIGRRLPALDEVARLISQESQVSVTTTLDTQAALQRADVVVTVTSAVDTVIEPEYLKSGAIVCDVARPRDVSKRVAEVRDDVFVFEGGVVKVPGSVEFGFNFGFPAGTSYACMAETMILALEGRYQSFTLGREITVDQITEIASLAQKHGFSLAGLRSFDRAVTDDEIRAFQKKIKGKRLGYGGLSSTAGKGQADSA